VSDERRAAPPALSKRGVRTPEHLLSRTLAHLLTGVPLRPAPRHLAAPSIGPRARIAT